jgi:hypothetical protein
VAEQFAPRLALIAVMTVFGRGMLADGDFEGTVKTAAVAAVVFFVLGLLVGEIAARLIEEHVRGEAAVNDDNSGVTTKGSTA